MALQASWTPTLVESEIKDLVLQGTTYALSHGLVYLPLPSEHSPQPPAPKQAIHAPFALLPTPFPRTLFERAKHIQRAYDVLYARVALDWEFLDEVMGGVGDVDVFTGALWRSWKEARSDGIKVRMLEHIELDWMLIRYVASPAGTLPFRLSTSRVRSLKRTRSKAGRIQHHIFIFGPLAGIVSKLHKHLASTTRYFGKVDPNDLPHNPALECLVKGLATSHEEFGHPTAQILFVIQDNERNVFDQRWLEYELLEKYNIHVLRQTMSELLTSASIDQASNNLIIQPSSTPISVVYFRATYTPTDFPTEAYWQTRILLEKSSAIKCPSLPLQLAGGKKVQQVLTKPGNLERFLHDFLPEEITALRETWVDLWGLDDPDGMQRAHDRHDNLVLKPQREGGGNNIYRSSIPPFLESLSGSPEKERERKAWIAMEMIQPPEMTGYMVRAGTGEVVKGSVVSELGIYGWALFGGEKGEDVRRGEDDPGWLVRTKGKESDEGGVAVGFSVLDSVVLV